MNACLFLVPLLAVTAASAAEQEPSAAAIVERYLKLPHPADDRLGKARQERWSTLSELKPMPDAAVREIARVLPDVQLPWQRMELAEALSFFPTQESAAKLRELLDDPDAGVRLQAIGCLHLMARRVDRVGGQRTQRGGDSVFFAEGNSAKRMVTRELTVWLVRSMIGYAFDFRHLAFSGRHLQRQAPANGHAT